MNNSILLRPVVLKVKGKLVVLKLKAPRQLFEGPCADQKCRHREITSAQATRNCGISSERERKNTVSAMDAKFKILRSKCRTLMFATKMVHQGPCLNPLTRTF